MSEATTSTQVTASVGTLDQTGGPKSISGGEAATFDDLDFSTSKALKAAKKDAKAQDEDDAPKKKDEKKSLVVEPKDVKQDANETDEPREKSAKKSDDKESKTEEKTKKELAKEIRKLKLKAGDKEIDVDEIATIRHKVDGSDVDVTMKDLLSNYSGKVAWDKRFSELDTDRKGWKSERETFESKIKSIMEAADPEERFYKMAEISGQDPLAIRRKFLEENMSFLEKYHSMTEDERKQEDLAFENKYLKQKALDAQKQTELMNATRSLETKVKSLSQKYGFVDGEMTQMYQTLTALAEQGKLPEGIQITPEFAAEAIMKDRYWAEAEKKLSEIGIEWPSQVKTQNFTKLVNLMFDQGMSPKETASLVDSIWGSEMAKQVIDEKTKQVEEFKTGKRSHQPTHKSNMDVWNFDQL